MPKLVLILALTLTACAGRVDDGAGASGGSTGSEVSLIRVLDGDTLVVDTPQGEERVRLSGVNAPDHGECGHEMATARLAAMVDDATLALAVEGTDQFGRVVGRVEADGFDVAVALVREGHGLAVAAAPNSSRLLDAEGTAVAEGVGMWATDVCGARSSPHVTFDPEASVTDPVGRDEEELHAEVIVLVNREDTAVDLSGWVLRDGSSRHRFRFGSGVVLGPGARIQIDSADAGWSPGGGPVWSNEGDIALLLDPSGGLVSHWRYGG